MASGYTRPRRIVVAIVIRTAMRRLRVMFMVRSAEAFALRGGAWSSLREVERGNHHVDDLDADEGHDDPSSAVDQQIPPEQRLGGHRAVRDAVQRQRNERDDD